MHILTVRGMTTAQCAGAVSTAIRSVDPCAHVVADPASGVVQSNSALPVARIAAAITAAGFVPALDRVREREDA